MGLNDAKKQFILAIEEGHFRSEARGAIEETNLLAIGDVTPDFVITLIKRTKGHEYETSPHHLDQNTLVHVFKPRMGGEAWYVKAYIESDDAVFISVHKSRYGK